MLIKEPLKNYKVNELLEKIGVSKAIIKTSKEDELGFLPVRTKIEDTEENYYPKREKVIIGTWTNQEIKYALEELNYQLLGIEQSVIYEEEYNPLHKIMNELYQKRQNTNDKFMKRLYKQLMNGALGKFAQNRVYHEYKYESVENAEELLNRS